MDDAPPTFTKIIPTKNVSYCYKKLLGITWSHKIVIYVSPFFPDKTQKEKVKEENLQFKMYLSWLSSQI